MITPRVASFAALFLLVAAGDALAFCLPIVHYRYVGDTASDPKCTDNDIQSAINNTTCPNTIIVITREHIWGGQALDINSKSLTLVGVGDGVTCGSAPISCDPTVGCGGGGGVTAAPNVTLTGNNAASVIYIHGNSGVTLESLFITGGGGTDYGGGIHFSGAGSLTVVGSTIQANAAGVEGGGIQFNGSGGDATLTLGAGTIIYNNASGGDGGGIHINGTAHLVANQPYTLISGNQATSHGGGLHVVGPARADIGSPGYNGAPVIQFNTAAAGGGIGIDAGQNDADAHVRLFTVDANNPVQVSNNRASNAGGAIWMHPFVSGISNTSVNPYLCAFEFRMDNNAAPEGSAIYADTDSSVGNGNVGSVVHLNTDDGFATCNTPETMASMGAVSCAPGIPCNTLNENVAEDASNDPKPGAVILMLDEGTMDAARFSMRGNTGGHAIRAVDSGTTLGNCLIADDADAGDVIRIESDGNSGYTAIDSCTIVNDTVGSGAVIRSPYPLQLSNSIVDESGIATLSYSGSAANLNVSYVLATDTATLPQAAGIDQGEPDYVSAGNVDYHLNDYHLKPTSSGIDFAPAAGGVDLDGNKRDVDLGEVPNNYGPRDLGAYERQFVCSADTVFCDGFQAYQ
jgi:hypothetical protein